MNAQAASASLSKKARTLLERPVIADVATVDANDRPQLTPVWIDVEDDTVVFNTAKGRAKAHNLEKNPYLAVSVVDPDDPYNVVIVRGTADITEDGADEHIDALAKKYLGLDRYPNRRPDEVRIKVRIRPATIVRQPAD